MHQRPEHPVAYFGGGSGVVLAIDPAELPGKQSVDQLLREHHASFHLGTVTSGKFAPPGSACLVGPNGEEILNANSGEWIVKGGIPPAAVISATTYRAGRVQHVWKNPAYRRSMRRAK